MFEVLVFLKNNLSDHFAVYFIPLYVLGGRPTAILSAQLLGFKMSLLLPVVVLLDTLQIPLFYALYSTISKKVFFQRLHAKSEKREKNLRESRMFRWIVLLGTPGVVAITMIPFKGCGMWSGVLLSRFLGLPKQISYPLLIAGSILGSLLVFGVGEGVLELKALLFGQEANLQ